LKQQLILSGDSSLARSEVTDAIGPAAPPSEIARSSRLKTWSWVPSLYFAEGVPYVVVMTVAVVMFKRLGVSNAAIALYTSWLYLPYAIKPLWSPLVQRLGTRRRWVILMQLLIGAGLACAALAIPAEDFVRWTLAALAVVAVSSATHDVAADGFYLLALSGHEQAWFVGIRSTAYRLAMIAGQGLLVMLAGVLERSTGSVPLAWSATFFLIAGMFVLFSLYHAVALPRPAGDGPPADESSSISPIGFLVPFLAFFRKPHILALLAFLLLYRFPEAQLVKLATPFLLDSREVGGLGLSTEEVGFVYGTIGVLLLTLGGILGGFLAARHGLKFWLWPMALAIHLPNAAFLYLAYAQPESRTVIALAVAVEQFGYGFGFTAYLLYCIYISRGEYETVHYALCTGFMALGMMVPGMWSGWLQEQIGYRHFFVWIMAAAIPSFIAVSLIPLDAEFGRKDSHA
jgi:PAT family beta-lactamase induction signal transducer AmpG